MDSSLPSSSWPAFTTSNDTHSASTDAQIPSSPSSAALDLLVALSTTEIDIARSWGSSVEALHDLDLEHTLGSGGFALVEQRRNRQDELVAVKRSRWTSRIANLETGNVFQRQFEQTTRELRILCFGPLEAHPNIVDIQGISFDEHAEYSYLDLLLECSTLGTLREFLIRGDNQLSAADLLALILQVSRGLEALHHYNICHGDVKTSNALVFRMDDEWRVKVSDFGLSIIGDVDDPFARVDCNFGTRLLNAPEVRTGRTFRDASFDLASAIRTDIFSFGLLSWEVCKKGRSFYDMKWIDAHVKDEEVMEEYLNNLPHNNLLSRSLEFVSDQYSTSALGSTIAGVFERTLQDKPLERLSIEETRRYIESHLRAEPLPQRTPPDVLPRWRQGHSLFQPPLEHNLIHSLPFDLSIRVLSELKSQATSPAKSQPARGHAALCVSECYLMGLGAPRNNEEALTWLWKAAELQSSKAVSWYPRIHSEFPHFTHSNEHVERDAVTEPECGALPQELYLSSRIRHQVQLAVSQVKDASQLTPVSEMSDGVQLRIFNQLDYDELCPIHVASLTGNDLVLAELLKCSNGNALSKQGFNAVHFACIGGYLSTLQLLIQHDISVSTYPHGISPLHLCIFFADDLANRAADVLIQAGASPTSRTTQAIEWEFHDIRLREAQTPLEWAASARHRSLFRYLLPLSQSVEESIRIATDNFFWDILEDSLDYLQRNNLQSSQVLSVYLSPILRPFSHWIAHGRDHIIAIERTVKLYHEYVLSHDEVASRTLLVEAVQLARVEDDYALIEILLEVLPSAAIKELGGIKTRGGGVTYDYALSTAIGSSARKHTSQNIAFWTRVIQTICGLYTVEELERPVEDSLFGSFLHLAVLNHSVTGTRVLLEKGVDVNQRTFDDHGATPMHICMQHSNDTEIYSLLKEFGADLRARTLDGGNFPHESRLWGDFNDFKLLAFAAQNDMDAFHFILGHAIYYSNTDALRYLLSVSNTPQYIDCKNDLGVTLIHLAVVQSECECLSLLLESNADASIPISSGDGETSLLPLQMACMPSISFEDDGSRDEESSRKAQAVMTMATMLLEWHHARSDGLFRGITKLHLAFYLSLVDEIQKLIEAGYSEEARGVWPGVAQEIVPRDLPNADLLLEDYDQRSDLLFELSTAIIDGSGPFPMDAEEFVDSRMDLLNVEGLSDIDWDEYDDVDAIVGAIDSKTNAKLR
jgi:ankyrin repeat protein/serine/threonine protein kinase